jgi:hypothetical protein
MNHELKTLGYRGVLCFRCKQPIPLPTTIADRLPIRPEDFRTGVFAIRCRTCHKESLYVESNFVECEGAPPARVFQRRTHAS